MCCTDGTFWSKDYQDIFSCCPAGKASCCDPLKDNKCAEKVTCMFKDDPNALKYCTDVLAPLGTDC